MTDTLKPFADDAKVLTIGDLTVENGTDAVTMTGDLTISQDKHGLEAARALAQVFTDIVKALEGRDLPERAPKVVEEGGVVDNPFTS